MKDQIVSTLIDAAWQHDLGVLTLPGGSMLFWNSDGEAVRLTIEETNLDEYQIRTRLSGDC